MQTVTYTHNGDSATSDSFYYFDEDGDTITFNITITAAPGTSAPVAGNVSKTVAANSSASAVTLAITGGTPTSVAVASAASHGTATASGTSITYAPTAGYSGSDSFTYTATNSSGTSSAATVSVTVTAPTLIFSPAAGALPGGTVGTPYSRTITTSAGTGPYTYTATGLPVGVTISSSGVISGTPTTAGSYSVTVSTTDANGATGSVSYTIAVVAQAPVANAVSRTVAANSSSNAVTLNLSGGTATSVAIASAASHGTASASGTSITYTPTAGYSGSDSFTYTATNSGGTSAPATVSVTVTAPTLAFSPASGALPGGTVGTSYSQTTTASAGTGPYSYTATGLPAGLTLSSSGVISGTPTTAGSYSVTVSTTDANGVTGSASYTIAVSAQAPVANAVSRTVAANSNSNTVTLSITGGAATSVAVASAASHGTATASGTSITYTPAAGYSGSDSFTYTATNASGTSSPATVSITVTAPTLAFSPPSGTLPGGTVGTSYSQTIGASGGTGPYSYAATGLPAGLTISASGAITGTPTTAGSYSVTVSTTDANGVTGSASYTIAVTAQAPVANAVTTTVAANSSGSAVTLSVTGGAATSVAVASAASHGTATASGTSITYSPTAGYSGSDSFGYTATNATGTSSAATVSITVTAPTLTLTPAPGALPGATSGTAYSQTITAANGTAPYSYAVTAGTLPVGLSLSVSGVLSGTPTAASTATFTITATDAYLATRTASYSLTVAPPGLAAPVAGAATATVAANSSTNPVTLSLSGGTAASVAISAQPAHGTATATGTALNYSPAAGYSGSDSFTYTATNATGTSSAATVTITVTAPTLAFTPVAGTLSAATVGTAYIRTIAVTGGTGPYSYAATGLPAGLTLNASTGTLSGTATTTGNFTIAVSATDAHGATGSASYTLAVAPPALAAPVAGPAAATVAANSSANPVTLGLSGGTAASVAVASQAAHGTATAAGTSISYTPIAGYSGSDSFTYIATNSAGTSTPAAVTLTVTAPVLAISPAVGALPASTVGTAYSQALTVTGGTAPYSVTATGLPAGVTLASSGAISGTPSAAGNFTVAVTATDARGATGAASYTLAVSVPTPVAGPSAVTVAANSSANVVALTLTGGAATSMTVATQPAHGTATAAGTSISYMPSAGYSGSDSFTYTASNAAGTSSAATVTITVMAPTLAFMPVSGTLPAATVGTAYSRTIAVSSGTGPYRYAATGLPAGLTLDGSSGTLSGTPTAAGTASITVAVADARGATGSASYTLAVAAQAPPVVADPSAATVPANTQTQAGQSVSISLSSLVTGQYDDIRIVTPPRHGTVTLMRVAPMGASGRPMQALAAHSVSAADASASVTAVYTPATNYQGIDSFAFVAVGPGGTSAPATATVQVLGRVPTSREQSVSTPDGQPVEVDLTTGATDGPFTAADIVSVTPADRATTTIVASGADTARTFKLRVVPQSRFAGALSVVYTLTNAFGTSAPITVAVNVIARPDPSADPVVRAISDAQAEATRQFSKAQVANFMGHAETLHGTECGRAVNGIRLGASDAVSRDRLPGQSDLPTLPATTTTARPTGDERLPDAESTKPAPKEDACRGPVGVWTGGTVDIGTRDAVTGRSQIKATTKGLSAGMDVHVAPEFTVGAGAGVGWNQSKVDGDNGRVTSHSSVLAGYASVTPTPGIFVDAMLAHGWLGFSTRRTDATTALQAEGHRDGGFTTGVVSAGVDRVSGALRWSVYGRGEYLTGRLSAYRETGADIYDLRFDDRSVRSIIGSAGFKTSYRLPIAWGIVTARLRGEWEHEFSNGTRQGVDYADITGASRYSIDSQGWSREQLLFAPGIEFSLQSGWVFGLDWGLRFASGERAASATLQVKKDF